MRFLLTSAGIKNPSIYDALVDLLGKPIAESNALCIPTAVYAKRGGADMAWRFITGRASTRWCELGWKSLGVLELTALPSAGEEQWVSMVEETDVLLVGGGDPMYLSYWMQQSGLLHPVAQIHGIAAAHQQDVSLLDHRDPLLFTGAGQRGELEHSQRLPTQFAQGGGSPSGDEAPGHVSSPALGVHRGGNAQGVGLGNRFTQEVDQCVVDARVLDASGSEKKPHDAPPSRDSEPRQNASARSHRNLAQPVAIVAIAHDKSLTSKQPTTDSLGGVDRLGQRVTPYDLNARHGVEFAVTDRKSTRLNSSHLGISYAVFCLKK